MNNVITFLQERGFIDAITDERVVAAVNKPIKLYVGFDPTSDSLHLGNLVGIIALAWFQRSGHTPIAIIGGATGMIGDPSGKSQERSFLDKDTIKRNLAGIRKNLEMILDFNTPENPAMILDNAEWFGQINCLDFLRDIGKQFRIGPMLAKESVKKRIQSEEGMSYTEFSYQLLQAYDFHYLLKHHQTLLQVGGSDQWGNITAGIEFIRRVEGKEAYGLTFPLITRSDGKKFGKTEKGAVWLSESRLPVYDFYQYLFRLPDTDAIQLLRMLTFMDLKEINKYEAMMQQADYVPNTVQKKLAEEVTRIVHREDGLETALKITQKMSPGKDTCLDAEALESIAKDVDHVTLSLAEIVGSKYVDLVVQVGFIKSKGEVRRLILNGGAYLNNEKISDQDLIIEEKHVIEGRFLLLGMGKKKKMLIRILD